MRYLIVSTTDGKFLGLEIDGVFPVSLDNFIFVPDHDPIDLGFRSFRFFNSNYSIDIKEA